LKATGERKRRTILATASENELERYADTISEAKGFGPSQRANLISDMRSYSIFEKYNNREDLRLVHNLKFSDPTFQYNLIPTYSLINVKTGLEYGTHKDVKHLLALVGIHPDLQEG